MQESQKNKQKKPLVQELPQPLHKSTNIDSPRLSKASEFDPQQTTNPTREAMAQAHPSLHNDIQIPPSTTPNNQPKTNMQCQKPHKTPRFPHFKIKQQKIQPRSQQRASEFGRHITTQESRWRE